MRATYIDPSRTHHPRSTRRLGSWLARLMISVAVAAGVFVPAPASPVRAAAATFVNSDITSVAVGGNHTCVVKGVGPSAAVYCWGSNSSGQLGNGTTNNENSPVPVADVVGGFTNSNIVGVKAGWAHTCVFRLESGSSKVYCWGNNTDGQLGNGTQTNSSTPVPVSNTAGVYTNSFNGDLFLGGSHTCVTRSETNVESKVAYCWGRNANGQLGDGTQTMRLTPIKVLDNPGQTFTNTGVDDMALGNRHTCAQKGGVVHCWGENSSGQLGNGTLVPTTSATVSLGTAGGAAVANNDYTEMNAGEFSTCAVVGSGDGLYCWGENSSGQLGLNSTSDSSVSASVLPGARPDNGGIRTGTSIWLSPVAGGGNHTCAIKGGGNPGVVYCWGANNAGQLGDGTSNQGLVPVVVSAGQMTNSSIKSVAAGSNTTCAIKGSMMTGVVYCWGFNVFGQLGNGTNTSSSTPVLVAGGVSSGAGAGAGSSSGTGTSTTSGPSLFWASLDTAGGTCVVDGATVTTTTRTPFLGYRYLPGADECSRSGFSFGGWARKSAPSTVVDLPRLIDEAGGRWRYFIADNNDFVAVWVSPGRTALFVR